MSKYELLRRAILEQAFSSAIQLRLPPAATDQEILSVHAAEYLEALKTGTLDPKVERRIGFPWSPGLLERSRRSVGGTLAACRAALEHGVGVNLAGGTHHAFRDCGEGFCVLNDSVVALRTLQSEGRIRHALILDTDVHQGNGTASILAQDQSIFTYSIHGAKNFPFKKQISDLDRALPDSCDDLEYLNALKADLEQLARVPADLIIFLSGADPFEHDKLGRLSLSKTGLSKRDELVFDWAARRQLPVAVTMGGGYAPVVSDIVEIHLQTVSWALKYKEGF